jgi:hypothetical protein
MPEMMSSTVDSAALSKPPWSGNSALALTRATALPAWTVKDVPTISQHTIAASGSKPVSTEEAKTVSAAGRRVVPSASRNRQPRA